LLYVVFIYILFSSPMLASKWQNCSVVYHTRIKADVKLSISARIGNGKLQNINHSLGILSYSYVRLTFWHRSFTFNSNKSPIWCNSFSVYYPDVCSQLNMFRAFSAHHQELNECSGSLWFYLRIVVTVVLCSWSGRPAGRPDHEHEFELYDDVRTYKL
jgi:hypothetical protein